MQNIADMEVFAAVVAAKSMSGAGRKLGLSPAVVSKRIRRLEDRLGTRLLHRTTRQVSLTEAGKGYHDRVVDILASVDEAESFVARRSGLARGVLKISAPTSFGRMHIAPHLGQFMSANPDLAINLDLSDQFVDIIASGFDLAIRIGELPDSSLVARKLAPVRRVLCASSSYIERHGSPATLNQLEQHACIAAHNQGPWRLEGAGGMHVYRPNSELQTNSSEVVREAVLSGLGIALRSTWDVGPELSQGRLSVVLPEYTSSKGVAVYAVYPSRNFLPTKVRVFIDFLAELYGPVPYWETGIKQSK